MSRPIIWTSLSCEALESALNVFPGTLILVSHDRYLVNSLAERIIHLNGNGEYHCFEGTYREFEAQSVKQVLLRNARILAKVTESRC